jgi:DNA polymerase III delta prime subunit
MNTLLFISDGDMRQALNNLQACFQSLGSKSGILAAHLDGIIEESVVLDICDAPNI